MAVNPRCTLHSVRQFTWVPQTCIYRLFRRKLEGDFGLGVYYLCFVLNIVYISFRLADFMMHMSCWNFGVNNMKWTPLSCMYLPSLNFLFSSLTIYSSPLLCKDVAENREPLRKGSGSSNFPPVCLWSFRPQGLGLRALVPLMRGQR